MTQSPASAIPGRILFHHLANAFRVDHLQPRRIQAAFKTASHEGLEQAVVRRVSFLLMLLDCAAFAIQTARDFLSQRLIPKLPAQPRGQLLGDLAAAASVLAFQGDHSDLHIQ